MFGFNSNGLLTSWVNKNIVMVLFLALSIPSAALTAGATYNFKALFDVASVISTLMARVGSNAADIEAIKAESEEAQKTFSDHILGHNQAELDTANQIFHLRNEFSAQIDYMQTSLEESMEIQFLRQTNVAHAKTLLDLQTAIDREERITEGHASAPPVQKNWENLERLRFDKRRIENEIEYNKEAIAAIRGDNPV